MLEGAGLYLHVPFCSAICPYCDFAVSRGDARARARFTAALVGELRSAAAARAGSGEVSTLCGAAFDTIYLGGGTPSFLAVEELATILAAARESLRIAADAFVVLEANPEDVSAETLAAWRAIGVRGLSLGIQSFDDRVLRFLGRRHTGRDARRAAELAAVAGFEWVSLDLLYGSPGGRDLGGRDLRGGAGAARESAVWDPLTVALADVEAAAGCAPHHVSCYQLTVHDGTPFAAARARGRLRELDADAQASLFMAVHEALAGRGLVAYEVSSFARGPEHRSRHNTKYWRHLPYLGMGPSAHSFDGGSRWWNVRDWRAWADRIETGAAAIAGRETLSAEDLALERLMLGLRTLDGLDLDAFEQRHGVDLLAANPIAVERAIAEGLLELERRSLRPTTRGLAVADALAAAFELRGAGPETEEAPGTAPAPRSSSTLE